MNNDVLPFTIKDNPVPSLDKEDLNFLISELALLEDKASLNNFGLAQRYKKIKNKLLQNGVETNNGQPDKKYSKQDLQSAFDAGASSMYNISRRRTSFTFDYKHQFEYFFKNVFEKDKKFKN